MENLEKEIISEWEEFYLNYKLLEKIIQPLNNIDKKKINIKQKEEVNTQNNINFDNIDNTMNEHLLSNNEQKEEEKNKEIINEEKSKDILNKYFNQLKLEINKFSYFNNLLQSKRHSKRFDEIIQQLVYLENHSTMQIFKDQLDESLKNFYREISNYQLFINTNIKIKDLTFAKIEEYSKIIAIDINIQEKKDEINSILESANEYNMKLLNEIKEQYSLFFKNKYRHEKKTPDEILRNYLSPEKERSKKKNTKILNILMTIMLILGGLIYIINSFYLNIDIDKDHEFRSIFPMYRAFGIICLYLWTLGFNVWVWNDTDINYKALFTFDNHYSTETEIFIRAAFFTNILFLSFLLHMIIYTPLGSFFNLDSYGIEEQLPGIMWLTMIIYFFWPFKNFNYYGRIYTMKLFGESMASILIPIEFKHLWFMDQLTSLIGPMRDFEYFLCYYSYSVNPFQIRELFCSNARTVYLIIAIFPNLFRCFQAGRQIIDNGKLSPYVYNIGNYAFNIIVATVSFLSNSYPNFFILWLITAFILGCYSSYWDIKIDFGYFESGAKNWPLRDKSKFKNKILCLLAIPTDIILRFLWMLSISHEIMERYIRPEFLALVLYILEIFRRAIWNLIRVEYEHFDLVKGYQISYYEELPLIKCPDGKFKVNEHNLINILNIEKHDRIRLALSELFNSLEKNKENEVSLDHMEEEKKYAHSIVNQLNEYLENYKEQTKSNVDLGKNN